MLNSAQEASNSETQGRAAVQVQLHSAGRFPSSSKEVSISIEALFNQLAEAHPHYGG